MAKIQISDGVGYNMKSPGEWAKTLGRMARMRSYSPTDLLRLEQSAYQLFKHAVMANEESGVRLPIKAEATVTDGTVHVEINYSEPRPIRYLRLLNLFKAGWNPLIRSESDFIGKILDKGSDEDSEFFSVYRTMDEFSMKPNDGRTGGVNILMEYARQTWKPLSTHLDEEPQPAAAETK